MLDYYVDLNKIFFISEDVVIAFFFLTFLIFIRNKFSGDMLRIKTSIALAIIIIIHIHLYCVDENLKLIVIIALLSFIILNIMALILSIKEKEE